MPRKKTEDTIDFEKSLASLEKIVEKLESGDSSLEESLKLFEEGIKLTRSCQQALQQAEDKITFLTQQNADWLPSSEETVGDFLDESK